MDKFQIPTLGVGITKSHINEFAKNSIDSVFMNGNIIEAMESLAIMDYLIKQIRDHPDFKEYALQELSKYGKNYISANGTKIEQIESGIKYDYSKCGDPILQFLEHELSILESSIKERKEFLKKVPKTGMDNLDSLSGEINRIYPPSKSSTSTYKVTITK